MAMPIATCALQAVSSTLCSACTIYSRFFKSCATSVNRLKFQRQIRFLPKAILKFASHDSVRLAQRRQVTHSLERRIEDGFPHRSVLGLVQVTARNMTFPLPDAEPAGRQHARFAQRDAPWNLSVLEMAEQKLVSCSCRCGRFQALSRILVARGIDVPCTRQALALLPCPCQNHRRPCLKL